MFARAWHSGTITTWASNLSRSLGILLILPLVLKQFSAAEFSVWALCSVFLNLQVLADMGFGHTFVRSISAAVSGASSAQGFLRNAHTEDGGQTNWAMVGRIVGVMQRIYQRLGLMYLAVIAVVGSLFMSRPIKLTESPAQAWIAWGIVVVAGYVSLRTSYLGLLLQGLNQVALFRRWESITALAGVLAGYLVLLGGGGLLALIAVSQAWVLIGVIRNRHLCRLVTIRHLGRIPGASADPEIFATLWPAAWRTGVGAIMSLGLVQASGIMQAQLMSASATASYLLCLRLLQLVSSFSQAPFYSNLPLLAQLRTKGRYEELLLVAGRGMTFSLWTYVLGFALAGTLSVPLLRQLGSSVDFPSAWLWCTLGTMFMIERYGAMHLNLYSTTNHIINHVVNGVTGLLCLAVALGLAPWLGMAAMPAGLLFGYLAFYSWYPAMHTYREFRMPFFRFERRTSLGPLLCFAVACGLILYLG